MKYGYITIHPFVKEKDRIAMVYENAKICAAGADMVVFDMMTGTYRRRDQFRMLHGKLMAGDVLITTRFIHLSDDIQEGIKLLQTLVHSGVTVDILNMGRVDSATIGRLSTAIALEYSVFQRELMAMQGIGVGEGLPLTGTPQTRMAAARATEAMRAQPSLAQAYVDHHVKVAES